MPSTPDIASALITWVTATIPEINSTHDYPHQQDPGPFPDLAVDFTQIDSSRLDPVHGAPSAHRLYKHYQAQISILVSPMPYRESAQQLWSMADRLISSQSADRTLAIKLHGVPIESGPWTCWLPGVITWPDGTEGRELVADATLIVPA